LFSRAAREAGFTVTTTEIADAERAIATETLGFEPHKFTFKALPEDETYDAIIMSQILEHARDPERASRADGPGAHTLKGEVAGAVGGE